MPPHLNDEKRKTDLAPDWDDDQRLHKRLSNALMRIRDVYGLTSRELAERIDVTESYMSQVLNCRRDVRLSMLNRISKEFGIEASELLEDKWGEAKLRRRRRKKLKPGAAGTE
ncbi:helix-turn-helix transcriptional regulator [Mesorhizobium sp. SP-1A]|uniref:helix-turn-helix domain-containing protein n=1 Tax=Mesorhizobium sp. SP-1A TaxID=3077840 RepID=UPI0028F6F817|nr:helix-turn-helix transcriptional regulator [Mesorhizobium sp. SP-1A]